MTLGDLLQFYRLESDSNDGELDRDSEDDVLKGSNVLQKLLQALAEPDSEGWLDLHDLLSLATPNDLFVFFISSLRMQALRS